MGTFAGIGAAADSKRVLTRSGKFGGPGAPAYRNVSGAIWDNTALPAGEDRVQSLTITVLDSDETNPANAVELDTIDDSGAPVTLQMPSGYTFMHEVDGDVVDSQILEDAVLNPLVVTANGTASFIAHWTIHR